MTLRLATDPAAFRERHAAGKRQLVHAHIVDDLETPVSTYLKLAGREGMSFLLESVEGGDWRGRYSAIGFAPDLVWTVRDRTAFISRNGGPEARQEDGPLDSLRRLVAETRVDLPEGMPPMATGLFGYLGYALAREAENLPRTNNRALDVPDAILIRPSVVAIFDNVAHEITLATTAGPEGKPDKALDEARARLEDAAKALKNTPPDRAKQAFTPVEVTPESSTSEARYREIVGEAQRYIKAGDAFQIVPSQRFEAPFPHDSFALYRALRRLNPSPFLFHLRFGDFSVVGSSPEILVRVRNDKVTIRPIAGTRPRGATPEEDQRHAEELLGDEKERAEHLMLLDLGRNDVGRVSDAGEVEVIEKFAIERYSHVMHIVSTVQGDLAKGKDSIDALLSGFPAGTVTGAPKIRAMEIIDQLEDEERGVYAGAVGYFAADGGLDTCIALRTGVVKDGKLHVRAGGGVVIDSDPEAERMETVHKSAALFRAAAEAQRFSDE